MNIMNELDSVKLNKDFQNISNGTEGVIVHKYNNKNFEVEFFDNNGDTIDVVTISKEYLDLIEKYNDN